MSAPCDMPLSAPVYSHTGTVSPIMRRIMPNTAAGETRCLLSLGNNYWGVLCVPACPNYLSFIACHSKWARVRKRRRGKKKTFARWLCYYLRWDTLEIQSISLIGENWHCSVKRQFHMHEISSTSLIYFSFHRRDVTQMRHRNTPPLLLAQYPIYTSEWGCKYAVYTSVFNNKNCVVPCHPKSS